MACSSLSEKKSVTHVSVSRPHHLDLENTPVSESIRDIVSFINETENCTRRQVLEKFAPEEDKTDSKVSSARTAVMSDLHWLVHQGHVIEYASGQMEVAPKPQPPQQKKKKPKVNKKTEERGVPPNAENKTDVPVKETDTSDVKKEVDEPSKLDGEEAQPVSEKKVDEETSPSASE